MAAPSGVKLLSRAGLGGFLQRVYGLWGCGSPWGVQSQQHRQFFWRKWKSSRSVVRPAVVRPAYSVPKHILRPDYVNSGQVPDWPDYIEIKDQEQIQDFIVHQETIRHNAYPSPLRYGGFPKSVCTSVNNVVCHGIPDTRQLQDGDIINVDVTVYLEGYHGDTSETFLIGCVDEVGRKLVKTARKCRDEAIAACKPGAPLCVIGNTISEIAHSNGFHVCPYFIGHGIEPILMEGSSEFRILKDKWTAVSADDKRSAQFEHTVVITSDGVDILTKLPEEDEPSPIGV
uniref:Methionyl aminopeptidase type 1D (mitochondrial) n=1 Tax=Oncorhynchus mykiss TaxID=8022 RepID=A0A8C7P9X9_ONCMY